jgi:hypothetical protein
MQAAACACSRTKPDDAPVVGILQPVLLDVLPQALHDLAGVAGRGGAVQHAGLSNMGLPALAQCDARAHLAARHCVGSQELPQLGGQR